MASFGACSHCHASDGLHEEEHNNERFVVCRSCGARAASVADLRPADFWAPGRNNVHQPEASKSRFRRQCEDILKAQVSRLGLCSGSVRKEAMQVLTGLKFNGRGFESDSVAAACILVALRSDRQAVSVRDLARKLDLNSAYINKVFKFIGRRTNVEVQARPVISVEDSIQFALCKGEFWSPEKDRLENDAFVERVQKLVALLVRMPRAGFEASESFAVAAAFNVYQADRIGARAKSFKLSDFLQECNLVNVDTVKTEKESSRIIRGLGELLQRLPHASLPPRLTSGFVLSRLADVLEHQEVLLAALTEEVCVSSRTSERPRSPRKKDLKISDKEINSYIRSSEEVEQLKPLYESLWNK